MQSFIFDKMNKMNSLRVTRMIVITCLFLLPLAYSYGQQREIGRFELVDSTYYVEKNGLMSSNANSLSKTGRPNIYGEWRRAGMPTYQGTAFLSNSIYGKDTIVGYLTSAPSFPLSHFGGCVTYQVEEIAIRYKYKTPLNDSAYLKVVYHSNKVDASFEFSLPKTKGEDYTYLKLWTDTFGYKKQPPFHNYYIRASHPKHPENTSDSSRLEVTRIITDVAQINCNKSFDFWRDLGYVRPIGWYSYKGYHCSHRNAYEGKRALALTGISLENGLIESFIERNFIENEKGEKRGGMAFSGKKDTLVGMYKFINNRGANQNAKVRLMLMKNNQMIFDSSIVISNPALPYLPFSLPFEVNEIPDTLRIEISSMDSMKYGDTLLIDDLKLASSALYTGESELSKINPQITIYPNPTTKELYIEPTNENWEIESILGMDMMGQKLFEFYAEPTSPKVISLENYQPGTYFIQVFFKNGQNSWHKIIKG